MSSHCKVCSTFFSSRQSLYKHRKRVHPDNVPKTLIDAIVNPPKAEEGDVYLTGELIPPKTFEGKPDPPKHEQDTIIQELLKPSKPQNNNILKVNVPADEPQNKKVSKVNMSTDEDSESESEDSESESEDSESELEKSTDITVPETKKGQDKILLDTFAKLYSHFDEDDVELCNDILNLLDVLKGRGCVTEREYIHIKSGLAEKIHLNLYESINSTVDNMTRDDQTEILRL